MIKIPIYYAIKIITLPLRIVDKHEYFLKLKIILCAL